MNLLTVNFYVIHTAHVLTVNMLSNIYNIYFISYMFRHPDAVLRESI